MLRCSQHATAKVVTAALTGWPACAARQGVAGRGAAAQLPPTLAGRRSPRHPPQRLSHRCPLHRGLLLALGLAWVGQGCAQGGLQTQHVQRRGARHPWVSTLDDAARNEQDASQLCNSGAASGSRRRLRRYTQAGQGTHLGTPLPRAPPSAPRCTAAWQLCWSAWMSHTLTRCAPSWTAPPPDHPGRPQMRHQHQAASCRQWQQDIKQHAGTAVTAMASANLLHRQEGMCQSYPCMTSCLTTAPWSVRLRCL